MIVSCTTALFFLAGTFKSKTATDLCLLPLARKLYIRRPNNSLHPIAIEIFDVFRVTFSRVILCPFTTRRDNVANRPSLFPEKTFKNAIRFCPLPRSLVGFLVGGLFLPCPCLPPFFTSGSEGRAKARECLMMCFYCLSVIIIPKK